MRWVLARALQLGRYEYPDAIDDSPSTFELAGKIELLDGKPTDPGVAADSWVSIEVYAGGRRHSIDYSRPPDGDRKRSAARGWTTVRDDLALRKKFDALVARAPVNAKHLALIGAT
jgi:hypothetical protein